MDVGSKTHIGLVRKANEDSYLIEKEKGIFAVADGMGGLHRGDVASTLAIEGLLHWIQKRSTSEPMDLEEIQEVMQEINQVVHTKQIQLDQGLMGTTLSLAVIDQNQVSIGHIGDSRIYLANAQEVRKLSEDHSYLAELLRQGEIEEEDLANNPQRNLLTKALGPEAKVEAQVATNRIQQGDYLVLCTDGLYKDLNMEQELLAFARESVSAKVIAEKLTEKALGLGGQDNVTVVVVRYE